MALQKENSILRGNVPRFKYQGADVVGGGGNVWLVVNVPVGSPPIDVEVALVVAEQ